jgi:hypothetical protein
LEERMEVSSARFPRGPSRKERGVLDEEEELGPPREEERAEMEPREMRRRGVVGRAVLAIVGESKECYDRELE